jgi:flagellar biosynthetic protein FliP
MRNILKLSSILQILFIIFVSTTSLEAETLFESFGVGLPAINVSDTSEGETTYSLSLQILALMTVLTVLPSLILGMTSFTRIIIVLSILRQAMGTQQTPPNQVLIAVALFLTLFIMSPTLSKINNESLSPYLSGDLTAENALLKASNTVKDFLVFNTRKNDLQMFADLAGDEKYESNYEVPLPVLLPAFITSELKTAFQIGFLLFLPFLVIDMVIASTLMSLGMMMLSPMLVSLPFKLLLFVLVDGWAMTVGSLVATYSSS